MSKAPRQTKRHPAEFVRSTFAHDRLAEFATKDGLEKQTGHRVKDWALVVAKELLDNALDGAEKIAVAPIIDVTVDSKRHLITIADNGSGIDPDTVKRITDFRFSVSDKAAYVSPTRGAQGNALSTILAMPFVLDPQRGETIIESRGCRHSITFSADPITKVPEVAVQTKSGSVKNGTRVSLQLASSLSAVRDDFFSFVQSYRYLNPHLTLRLSWDKRRPDSIAAIDRDWTKWTPGSAIPAH
jgi:DNA topoisomerase VI subunit B